MALIAFLSVEDNRVVEIDLEGKVKQSHEMDRLLLQDVAITDDEERMLAVAVLLRSKQGLEATMSKAENRVIGMSSP